MTPTDAAIEAVAECGRIGVKVATVLADGFAEAGAWGEMRVARLAEICRSTGIRVVGPSSLGMVDLRSKAMLTANACFDEKDLPAGRIFAASHSGSMIGALLSRGKARGIDFAGLVSVGNEVDLSLGEICEATLDDDGIDGYMLFLETMRHCDALRRFASWRPNAAGRSSPTSSGARRPRASLRYRIPARSPARMTWPMPFSPTAASRVFNTLDGLIEGLPLLMRVPPPLPTEGTGRAARRGRGHHHHRRRRDHGGRSAGGARAFDRAAVARHAGAAQELRAFR